MANRAKLPITTITNQSNYITLAGYDLTRQEKRILYRIVEAAAEYREQNKAFFDMHKRMDVLEDKSFLMPISNFLTSEEAKDPSGTAYEQVVDAFDRLVKKVIKIKNKGYFDIGGVILHAWRNKGEASVSFLVNRNVWQAALDFTSGFTKLDIATAFNLKSAYSMRFYEMAKIYHDTNVWRISVEDFRKQFGCESKYPIFADLRRYTIDVAKKELDTISPISFTYEQEKKGRKVVKFKFTFELTKRGKELKKSEQEEKRKLTEIQAKYAIDMMDCQVKHWLRDKLNMNTKEISSNIKTWTDLEDTFKKETLNELEETFQYINRKGYRAAENVGWFIQNIKKKIENARKK